MAGLALGTLALGAVDLIGQGIAYIGGGLVTGATFAVGYQATRPLFEKHPTAENTDTNPKDRQNNKLSRRFTDRKDALNKLKAELKSN